MSKYLIWHPLVKRIQNLFKSFVISNHTDHTGKCFHHFSHLKVYDSVLYHAASHHAIRVPQPLQLKVEVPGLTLRSVLVRGEDPELPELSMKFVDVCWLRTVQTCSRSSHTYGLRSCCAFISWQIEIRSAFYCVQWSDLILLLLDNGMPKREFLSGDAPQWQEPEALIRSNLDFQGRSGLLSAVFNHLTVHRAIFYGLLRNSRMIHTFVQKWSRADYILPTNRLWELVLCYAKKHLVCLCKNPWWWSWKIWMHSWTELDGYFAQLISF